MIRWVTGCTAIVLGTGAWAQEAVEPQSCLVSVALEYFQRGAEAEVRAEIDTPDCAAATGTYTIVMTVRADGAQEPKRLKFPETWSRDEAGPLIVEKRYPIGDNVDLRRIRVRKLSCTCADSAVDAPAKE